jgi:hypothetical protein
MRPQSVSVSSATTSAWVPLDRAQAAFGVGFNVDLNSTSSGITFSVQHTFDDLGKKQIGTISRALDVVTVTTGTVHNLNTGDSVTVLNANQITGASGLDGQYTVTVSSPTVFTYTSPVSGTVSTTSMSVEMILLRVQPHSSIIGNTASVDGNYAFPITAMRLNVSAWVAGTATLTVNQGRK